MLPLALLFPLSVLAAPYSYDLVHVPDMKRAENAPWAPATAEQGPFDICSDPTHQPAKNGNSAPWSDCLGIRDWARVNKGEWVLSRTTDPNNDSDWNVLHKSGDCAFLVKNTEPTDVGNKDVADLLDGIYSDAGSDKGKVEEQGSFSDCHGGVSVNFLLRNANGL
ncbi:hypothetical protein AAE478_005025 [Parahypoxylon ruwenzoriense]